MVHLYHKANTEIEHLLQHSMMVLKAHVFAALRWAHVKVHLLL